MHKLLLHARLLWNRNKRSLANPLKPWSVLSQQNDAICKYNFDANHATFIRNKALNIHSVFSAYSAWVTPSLFLSKQGLHINNKMSTNQVTTFSLHRLVSIVVHFCVCALQFWNGFFCCFPCYFRLWFLQAAPEMYQRKPIVTSESNSLQAGIKAVNPLVFISSLSARCLFL